jgi:hypothetical protein
MRRSRSDDLDLGPSPRGARVRGRGLRNSRSEPVRVFAIRIAPRSQLPDVLGHCYVFYQRLRRLSERLMVSRVNSDGSAFFLVRGSRTSRSPPPGSTRCDWRRTRARPRLGYSRPESHRICGTRRLSICAACVLCVGESAPRDHAVKLFLAAARKLNGDGMEVVVSPLPLCEVPRGPDAGPS